MLQDVPMRERILETAERLARSAGYAEMTYREIAKDIGIKSASVHYHFPTKAELGVALVEAYAARFRDRLNEIDQSDLQQAIAAYINLYQEAFVLGKSICLCAMLGAEANGLPAEVNAQTRLFFEMNIDWLTKLFERHLGEESADLATLLVTSLEGAMIVASVRSDGGVFGRIAGEMQRLIQARE
jgi:TetR/AcrR family transcriptional regulator, transcriptional repressor for nem operon